MKIIKRKREAADENISPDTQNRLQSPNQQTDDRRGMVNVVKSWIIERDANRRAEKVAATRSLFDWKTVAGSN